MNAMREISRAAHLMLLAIGGVPIFPPFWMVVVFEEPCDCGRECGDTAREWALLNLN